MNIQAEAGEKVRNGRQAKGAFQGRTKERILDAAEQMIARHGFHGTSLRMLTAEAGVNLAAVNYHFGSKEALLGAVFNRRLSPLNSKRVEGLKAIRARTERDGVRPAAGEVLEVFIVPVCVLYSSDDARAFVTIVGRAFAEPDSVTRTVFMEHMRPALSLCHELLCEALPHLSGETVFWRLLFSLGAMSRLLSMEDHSPILPEGMEMPRDPATMMSLLGPFVTAGMEAT